MINLINIVTSIKTTTMKRIIAITTVISLLACQSEGTTTEKPTTTTEPTIEKVATTTRFDITPISHATIVFNWDEKIIYTDPVGGKEAFEDQPAPDIILVTDIHGDHLNVETLLAITTSTTKIIAPQAVADKFTEELLTQTTILNNGATLKHHSFTIEAIPMYNLREEALKFHEKGRGNGYVIEKNDQRIYISGDTEDIPEMRALQNIDIAFVCMNLPYTMTIESAADAVLEFQPKKVYPYHYRGTEGLSDVQQFKALITNPAIEVIQLDWYPNKN